MVSRFEDLNERIEYLEETVEQLKLALKDSTIKLKKTTGTGKNKKTLFDIDSVVKKENNKYRWKK